MTIKNSNNKTSTKRQKIRRWIKVVLCIMIIPVTSAYIFFHKKMSSPPTQPSLQLAENTQPFSAKNYKLIQNKRCAGCHGTKGQGRLSVTAPPLAGQNKKVLIRKIKAYRSGENNNPAMRLMTKDLTDEEINVLAEYYSQFQAP